MTHLLAKLIDHRIVFDRAKNQSPRKTHRTVKAHARAPFGILTNEQRDVSCRLKLIRDVSLYQRASLQKNNAPDLPAFDTLSDVFESGRVTTRRHGYHK